MDEDHAAGAEDVAVTKVTRLLESVAGEPPSARARAVFRALMMTAESEAESALVQVQGQASACAA